jgi:magnesium transporter
MAEVDQLLTSVMRRKPVTVEALEDQESVAKKIAKYNLLAVPVLESDGNVVGFVTVDDVVDVLIEEQTEDILKMAAVQADALRTGLILKTPLLTCRAQTHRLALLALCGRHTDQQSVAQLLKTNWRCGRSAFFVPLLIGTGGNAGSQTVMTVITQPLARRNRRE